MTTITVPVVVIDDVRQPDLPAGTAYTVISDAGEEMAVQVHRSLADVAEQLPDLSGVAAMIEAVDALRPDMLTTAQAAMVFCHTVGNDEGDLTPAQLTSIARAKARILFDLIRSVAAIEARLTGDPQAAEVVTSTVLEPDEP